MSAPCPVLLMARGLDLGGTERQMTETAKCLDRSRFTPHVACFRDEGFRASELRAGGVPVVPLGVRSFRSVSAIRGARVLASYIRQHGIRLVHTFDVPANVFGVPAARAAGTAAVLSSQRAHRSLTPGLMRHLLRLTDRMVDAVVVNCRAVERDLIAADGVPPGLIRLCRNGIDTSVFRPAAARASASGGLVIGCVAALRAEKDLGTLLDAFQRLRGTCPALRLVIAGAGPALPSLVEHRAALGLPESSCVFHPATADVAGCLHGIDIFVLPSVSEALSNSLMEAMACGCCVVASRVGGNPELVADAQTGLLFQPGDADDLAAKLRVLIENEELRRRLADNAAALIRAEFSIESAARRMGEIYDEVLS
jgi:glycosyltransferase involved in cell wall biosynthesis